MQHREPQGCDRNRGNLELRCLPTQKILRDVALRITSKKRKVKDRSNRISQSVQNFQGSVECGCTAKGQKKGSTELQQCLNNIITLADLRSYPQLTLQLSLYLLMLLMYTYIVANVVHPRRANVRGCGNKSIQIYRILDLKLSLPLDRYSRSDFSAMKKTCSLLNCKPRSSYGFFRLSFQVKIKRYRDVYPRCCCCQNSYWVSRALLKSTTMYSSYYSISCIGYSIRYSKLYMEALTVGPLGTTRYFCTRSVDYNLLNLGVTIYR